MLAFNSRITHDAIVGAEIGEQNNHFPLRHWQRSEKTLESAVCGFKGFLASLEMACFARMANILNISMYKFMWVTRFF